MINLYFQCEYITDGEEHRLLINIGPDGFGNVNYNGELFPITDEVTELLEGVEFDKMSLVDIIELDSDLIELFGELTPVE